MAAPSLPSLCPADVSVEHGDALNIALLADAIFYKTAKTRDDLNLCHASFTAETATDKRLSDERRRSRAVPTRGNVVIAFCEGRNLPSGAVGASVRCSAPSSTKVTFG